MVHKLVQGLERITNERRVKLLDHQDLSELNYNSIKDGNCNLHRVNLA